MPVKRLQNRIAESRLLLPSTALLTVIIWLAAGMTGTNVYIKFAVLCVSTYLMVELNNRNSLIRTYSRMVSCSFLVLTTMAAPLFSTLPVWFVQLLMIAACSAILRCYQDKRAQGMVFHAFFFIGIASTQFVQILFLVPFLWITLGANMMALCHRTLWASVIGLTAPYWFLSGYYVFTGEINLLVDHFTSLLRFAPVCSFGGINMHIIITFAFVSLLTAIGAVNFLRNSYKDKIHTRMIYEMLITVSAAIFVFAILQPQHILPLLAMMIVNASVLTAHFIALTHTRATNIAFCIIVLLTLALTVYNIWIP